jgi:GNAT superfamily N-acetyltransferase
MKGVAVRHVDLGEVADRTADLEALYAEVYREPPYEEGPEMAADFVQQLAHQREQPGFSMVVAEAGDGSLVGFAYGLTFPPDRWWRHAGNEPESTKNHPKFAIMEFAVRPPWRGNRIGSALMAALLSNRAEPVGTLCANPAAVANKIYRSWGWRQVATSHQPAIGPMEVLVKVLPSVPSPAR